MKSETSPGVIACVPCYNAEAFIERALQSLKDQTYSNFRVLISDDCSKDNTVEVIEQFIRGDDRFILYKQKENLGWIDNMNFLLHKAVDMSDYIFMLPHDDVLVDDYIQKLKPVLESHPKAVIVYGDIKRVHVDGEADISSYPEGDSIPDKMERLKTILRKKGKDWVTYRGIMRSEAVRNIIPIRKNLFGQSQYYSDWLWLIKLAQEGEIIRVPDVLYTKYMQPTSYSRTWAYTAKNFFGVLATCSLIIWKFPLSVSERISLQLPVLDLAARYIAQKTGIYFLVQKMRRK